MAPGKNFEDLFHEMRPGLHWRLWRDVRCVLFLGTVLWRSLTLGRRVRRKYRACKASGEPFWLDEGNQP